MKNDSILKVADGAAWRDSRAKRLSPYCTELYRTPQFVQLINLFVWFIKYIKVLYYKIFLPFYKF